MSQPEAKLSRQIQRALRERGAWVYKVHGGPLTPAGIPDIVGVYRGHFMAWETKMPEGRGPSLIQQRTHALIERAGGTVTVPRSVPDALAALDRVDATLDAMGGPGFVLGGTNDAVHQPAPTE